MAGKLLFLLKMPPPLTGATFMNSVVYNSALLDRSFSLHKIGISYASSVKDLGSFQPKKLMVFIAAFFKLLYACVAKRPAAIYFQPSILGLTYYRDLVLILLGRLLGKTFILHLHGKGIRAAVEKSGRRTVLYKWGIRNQYVIVLAQSQKSDIAFLEPKRIFVVNNGIDLLSTAEPRIKLPHEGEFRFLFLSNLLKSKGILDLVEAVKSLREEGLHPVVDVVGNEGDISRAQLMKAIGSSGLQDCIFYHGPKYGDDRIPFFENADAFVFPTRNEAFGLVLVEAMQFGLPIVASDEGAIPELVENGRSGFVFPKGDAAGLVQGMRALMNDRRKAVAMGAAGRAIYFEKFTINQFEKNMLHVFNETLTDLNQ